MVSYVFPDSVIIFSSHISIQALFSSEQIFWTPSDRLYTTYSFVLHNTLYYHYFHSLYILYANHKNNMTIDSVIELILQNIIFFHIAYVNYPIYSHPVNFEGFIKHLIIGV